MYLQTKLFFLIFIASHSFADVQVLQKAKMIDMDTGEELFVFQRTRESTGDNSYTDKLLFHNMQGDLQAEEEIRFQNGKWVYYATKQLQLRESGVFEKKAGKIHFSYEKEGQKRKDTIDDEGFSIPPEITDIALENMEKIKSGKAHFIQLLVPVLQDDIGFKYKINAKEKDKTHIVFKASNFFVSMFAPAIDFYFDGNRLLKTEGTSLLRKKVADNWEEVRLRTEF